ncbi:acyl carrier protein [Taibaiella sp. KBW10]|uniref:acyl carrier protein n=1 Tax=Taibaiella sp. KBW10 TaxID=2153357 RepID=UPI001F253EE4|nr:acyl carrier protein [Taibaiella sp. KBW10]
MNNSLLKTMEKAEMIAKINHFLVEDFEVAAEDIKPESKLKETLDLDSLDYIDLIVVIENNFGFKVKPEDFQSMETIQDFYNYVAQRLQAA